MPSQRMVRGIQVIDGSGRSSEMNGSMMAFGGPPHRHHHTERDGDETGEHEAGEDAFRGDQHRSPQIAGGDQVLGLRDDLGRRWQEDRRDRAGGGGDVPREQEGGDRRQTDGRSLTTPLPSPCGRGDGGRGRARYRHRPLPPTPAREGRGRLCAADSLRHEAGVLPLRHVGHAGDLLVVIQPLRPDTASARCAASCALPTPWCRRTSAASCQPAPPPASS